MNTGTAHLWFTRHLIHICLGGMLACSAEADPAADDRWDWNRYPPVVAWRAEVGSGFGSVAVSDDSVFAFGNVNDEDRVTAFELETGRIKWLYRYPCRAIGIAKPDEAGPRTTPLLLNGAVYTLSRDGRLLCLAAADGQLRWWIDIPAEVGERPPYWGFASSPLVWDDLLIWSVGESGLALRAKDGQIAWKSVPKSSTVWREEPVGVSGYASPQLITYQGREVVALANEKEFLLVKPSDGRRIWSTSWAVPYGVTAAAPVVAGEHVILSGGYGYGTRMVKLGGEGQPVWSHKRLRSHTANLAVVGEYLYGIDGNQQDGDQCQLRCLRLADGEVVWSRERFGFGNLTLVGNKLVVLSMRGDVIVVATDPAGYRELGRISVLGGQSWTAPLVTGNQIFVRNKQGTLAKLQLR